MSDDAKAQRLEIENAELRKRLTALEANRNGIAYHSLFENSHAVMLIIDPGESLIVDANSAAAAYYGWPRETLKGMPIDRINTLNARQLREELQAMSSSRRNYYLFQHRLADGTLRDVEVYSGPIQMTGRELLYSIVHDITERKHAQEALEQREHYYRSLMFNLHEDILVIDRDYRISDINNTALVTLGRMREEVIGKHCYEISHGLDAPCHTKGGHCALENVFETGEACNCHHVHIRADGTRVQIELLMSPLKDDRGCVTHVVEAARDVTDLIQAQEALQASERKYRLLADNTLDAIWTMDLDLSFTYVNPASLTITGHAPEAFIGTRLQDHCDPENFQKMAEAVVQGIIDGPEGGGVIFEAVMLRKNREPFPVEIHGKVIFDANGQPVGLQGITRDITDRLAAEQERRKLQEQLYQAQKMESVGRLAGGVAHDFNNLLSVILGYGEMILDDLPVDHPHHEALNEIHSAAIRAKGLTRQLLAFSRKQILEMHTVDINGVVTGFQKLLRRIIGEDIALEFFLDADPLRVRADTAQLEQVLLNLAVNARDAMVDGGTLTIETTAVALDPAYANGKPGVRPGRYAMISVTDTGPGMDQETLGHLFEPFFTTKPKDKGTGLGLATSYGIVKQHEGNIWVYSESGHGTTFKIYLPLTEQPEARPADMDSPKTPVATALSATVLVVEDDPAVRRLVCNILGRAGYQVIESQTAANAIELARERTTPIDLVLTDVIMPVMKGNEVFEAVRRHHPAARVLYMSGYTDKVIAQRGILDQGVAILQKPFSRESLVAKVRKVLEAV